MEAGELEIRQAFEEVTTRNVKAAIEFTNETRRMVKVLEDKVQHLEDTIVAKDKLINEIKGQISFIQQKLYTGGLM